MRKMKILPVTMSILLLLIIGGILYMKITSLSTTKRNQIGKSLIDGGDWSSDYGITIRFSEYKRGKLHVKIWAADNGEIQYDGGAFLQIDEDKNICKPLDGSYFFEDYYYMEAVYHRNGNLNLYLYPYQKEALETEYIKSYMYFEAEK